MSLPSGSVLGPIQSVCNTVRRAAGLRQAQSSRLNRLVAPLHNTRVAFLSSRVCICLTALLLIFQSPTLEANPPQKPNIVFILADDLGYGDLGCYGQTRIATPHIDQLAHEGVRFTQFYAGSTVCAPSRCVLMSGLHTGHCYIRGNADASLRASDATVAQLLKNAGYTTGIFGKWGLAEEGTDGVPTRKGFDEFFGYLNQHHAHNYFPAFLIANEGRVSLKNTVPGQGLYGSGVASKKVEYSPDLIVERRWISSIVTTTVRFFSSSLRPCRTPTMSPVRTGWRFPTWASIATKTGPSRRKGSPR